FNPALVYRPGADIPGVLSLALQADGRIVVGGNFLVTGPQARTNFVRLNLDGTADVAFTPAPNGRVFALATQTDGKIVLGGDFGTVNRQSRASLARVNPDGSLDDAINSGVNHIVYSLGLQNDG